jgi:hypothetical protein
VRGAATTLAPWEGALAAGLCETGCAAVEGVEPMIVVIVPFTSFFCFVDDVENGRRCV